MRKKAFACAAGIFSVSVTPLFAAVPAGSSSTTSQPLYDPFGYYGAGSGDLYNNGPWKTTIASSGVNGSVNQVQVINDNLTYSGLNASANGAVDLDPTVINGANTYEGLKLGIGTVAANDGVTTQYFSMLVKATDLTLIPTTTTVSGTSASATIGAMIAGFNTDRVANTMATGTSFLRVRRAGGSTDTGVTNWEIGVQRDSAVTGSGIAWDSGHALNDTVMVVGRVKSVAGTSNDQIDLWVNPSSSNFGLSETDVAGVVPTATLTSGGTDRSIADFFLRRQIDGAHVLIDDVRLSNQWSDVAPLVWRGDTSGDDSNWGASTNWQNGVVPDASGIRPSFLDISTASKTPNLSVNRTVGGLTFNSATSYTLSADAGASLVLSTSDITKRPIANVASGLWPAFNAATIGVGAGSHTISAPVTGNVGLIVQGEGTVNLTNSSNSYTGVTVLGGGLAGGGKLGISADSCLGPGTGNVEAPSIYGDGGTLKFLGSFNLGGNRTIQILDRGLTIDTNGNNTTYSAKIFTFGDTSPLTKTGDGEFNFVGGGASYRSLILKGGTFSALHTSLLPQAPSAAIRITFDGGTLRIRDTTDGSGPDFGANRNVTVLAGGGTINLDNIGSSIISGALTGVGPLTKSGAGTLSLTNSNTYNGTLTIADGNLNAASLADIGINSAIGRGSLTSTAADLVLNGGTLQYTGSSPQSTNRLFTLGTSSSGLDASGASDASVDFNGTGAMGFTGSGARSLTLTGSSNGANNLAAAIGDGPGGATAIVKSGGGTWNLSGNNNYTGGTTVQAGTLKVAKLHANNPVTITGGTLRVLDSSPTLPSHPSGDDAQVSQPKQLTISGAGTLDLGNNDMIIDYSASTPYGGTSPAAAIEALIAQGFNAGDWLGTGITSSAAASVDAAGNFVLGIVDNATLPQPYGISNGGDNFSGIDVPVESVLVKFTHRADINLDGLVTDADAILFSTNYEAGAPATWSIGDLDYDGVFSDNDSIIFGTYYDTGLAHLPEPASLGLLGVAAIGLLQRRRRCL